MTPRAPGQDSRSRFYWCKDAEGRRYKAHRYRRREEPREQYAGSGLVRRARTCWRCGHLEAIR